MGNTEDLEFDDMVQSDGDEDQDEIRPWRPALSFDNRRTGGPADAKTLSAAFWTGWLEHKDYLWQLAMRWMSGNRADAEDLLSRSCIKAHDRYLRDAHRIRRLRSWLARLLHNACMDEHRRRQVRVRVVDQFHPDQIEYLALGGSPVVEPEARLDAEEDMTAAMTVIMDMPERLRTPFVLRFIYQYSNQEIARHLELTEVNVRKRIQLGRTLVRGRLELG
ncbi:RNA polymerase sigma factor [Govanella unica]|uniref:Sigma-70 family RNA polymerase sigma factor n=1 Tax=Govanella unica TaxID=2975056 RepID=A0A9X3TWB6_9PROT|nr:sigma-70 family RNA polymerase sigma factor [Govania unica]MDA5193175.1 sigma-70 family RNA polymerase sigma factor [Govania unica]